jgi:hypothetical protein
VPAVADRHFRMTRPATNRRSYRRHAFGYAIGPMFEDRSPIDSLDSSKELTEPPPLF